MDTAKAFIVKKAKQKFPQIVLVVGFIILGSGVTALSPIIYRTIIDTVVPGRQLGALFIYLSLLIVIPLINMAMAYWKDRAAHFLANDMSESLRRACMEATLHMKVSEIEKMGYQQLLKTITREVGRISEVFIADNVMNILSSGVQLIVTFIMLFALQPVVAVAALFISPVLYFVIRTQRDRIGKREGELFTTLKEGEDTITQVLMGIKTVKSYNAQGYEMRRFQRWLDRNRTVSWRIQSAHKFAHTIYPQMVHQVMYGLVFILCVVMVWQERMTIGTLVAAIAYVPTLFSAINVLIGIQIDAAAMKSSFENIDKLLNAPREPGYLPYPQDSTAPVIEIRNLNFSYGREGFSLKINELIVKRGEIVAIVGPSGAGKSSLFDLIMKFYQAPKDTLWICGMDVVDISPDSLRERVGIVSQEVFLWSDSVRENILYPDRPWDETAYRRVVEQASLTSFLEHLPEGDGTVLGDFGSQISGGERQRITIARALYGNYEIMLLDEPTSALDGESARKVFETLQVLKRQGKTILYVTHDNEKCQYADQILEIENGILLRKR